MLCMFLAVELIRSPGSDTDWTGGFEGILIWIKSLGSDTDWAGGFEGYLYGSSVMARKENGRAMYC